MLKQLLCLFAMVFTINLVAQELPTADLQPAPTCKFGKLANHFSITATAGTGYYRNSFSDLGKLSLGELNIQYKASPMFSFGIGTMGTIQNNRSFYNNEGLLVSGCDNDDDEIEDSEIDDPNDMDDIDDEHQDGCDDDDEFDFGDNLMGNFTFHLPGKLPFFLQVATGYSFGSQAPAYSFMAGYNQKLFAGVGIMAGIRYSNIVSAKNFATKPGGVKAELGLNWNF